MKKNLFLRIALLVLVSALATSAVFVGTGTSAKYVAAANANASATVAKFDVQLSQNGGTKSGNIASTTVALTASTLGTLLEEDVSAGETDQHVTDAATGRLIAPGTGGKSGKLTVHNDSEVLVKVWLSQGTGESIPEDSGILFSGNSGGNWRSTIQAALQDMTAGGLASNAIPIDINDSHDFEDVLLWKWPFGTPNTPANAQDGYDTGLGVAGTAKLTIPVKINVEQVD